MPRYRPPRHLGSAVFKNPVMSEDEAAEHRAAGRLPAIPPPPEPVKCPPHRRLRDIGRRGYIAGVKLYDVYCACGMCVARDTTVADLRKNPVKMLAATTRTEAA